MPGNHTTHGLSKTPEYRAWQDMMRRCYDPRRAAYERYGARGIRVCDAWHDFETFYRAMGPRPSDDHSLERRRNNEGYDPDNCIWATRKEQCNNRRSNVLITYNGKTQNIRQWCDELGLNYPAVYYRVKTAGLSGREALYGPTPVPAIRRVPRSKGRISVV